MKIAASDYDGTLFRRGRISREDMEAIEAWRERGHLFGLATGRDLNLMRSEIEARSIPFDFVVCNTGASVYDGDFRPLHLAALPPAAAAAVIDHPAVKNSRYCLFSRAGKTFIDLYSSESWLTGLGLPLIGITTEEARQLTGLQQIGLEYPDPESARAGVEALNRDLGGVMYAQQSGFCVDVIAAGVSKAEGLAMFLELKGLEPEAVVTVGDSENDLSMFSRFQGYAVSSAPPEIRAAAQKTVAGPADVLWEHLD